MVDGLGSDDDLENIWQVPIALHYSRCKASHPPDEEEIILRHAFDVLMKDTSTLEREDTRAQAESAKYTIRWRAHSLRSFVDDAGRPGVGPKSMGPGDQIVIFAGGCAPFAVREVKVGDEKFYRLLGSVYVYGLMDGEAMGGHACFENIALI